MEIKSKIFKVTLMITLIALTFTTGVFAGSFKEKIEVELKPYILEINGREAIKQPVLTIKGKEIPSTITYQGVQYMPVEPVLSSMNHNVRVKGNTIIASQGEENKLVKIDNSREKIRDSKSNQEESKSTAEQNNERARDSQTKQNTVDINPALLSKGEIVTDPIEWVKFESDKLNFYFTELALGGHDHLYKYHSEIVSGISSYFGNEQLDEEVTIYIHASDKYLEFHRQANFNGGSNSMMINADGLSNRGKDNKQDVRYHLAHELTHAFVDDKWGTHNLHRDGLWINEGIAEYVAKHIVNYTKVDEQRYGKLKDLKYNKEYYSDNVKKITKGFDFNSVNEFSDTEQTRQYLVFESIIFFLEDNYGQENLFSFISDIAEDVEVKSAFINNFNKNESQLVREWKKYYGF